MEKTTRREGDGEEERIPTLMDMRFPKIQANKTRSTPMKYMYNRGNTSSKLTKHA